ncbi:MAG: tetratricopeptide repeat protein [Trueperaceae bacterium]|nr:MAG: tetratricopeptide repeat protein [Trueperaceae bacterium]
MARLSLYLFGTPRVEVDGTPVSIGHSKGVALLAYLAVTGRPHARESLAALLWPDHEAASALGEVRRMLWALNKALGKGWLLADRQTIAIQPDADIWVDVNRFHLLLDNYRQHGHRADEVCPECLDPLTEAIPLAHETFLAGFSLVNSVGFDDWQAQESQFLHRQLVQALQKRISLLLDSTENPPAQTISDAQRLLSLDPLAEPSHRLLMSLYAASNQPGEVARQYEECIDYLRTELDVSPSTETTALYERIRVGSFDAASEFAKLPHRVVRPENGTLETEPAHNLPGQITPFIGREFEITALTGLLLDPSFSLVSIVAPGGMGKTRLAIEVGNRIGSHFQHGVTFVELAPLGDGADIVAAIAEAAGYHFQQSGRSQKQQVKDYLANKEILLILDNFEHLLDGANIVTELLSSAPRLKILVTSRQRIDQAGETLFNLHGMSLPASGSHEEAAQAPAVELFRQYARRVRPDFELTAENLHHVVEICRLLQGMPLGILLAAQWVTILTSNEIVSEIEAGLDILEAEGNELPERLRSMRAVLDQSWNMMTDEEQWVFMKLSVFRGGFRREAGRHIAGAGLRQLQTLTNKGLIERDGEQNRFYIHELLRQYATEQLERSGQSRQVAHDHSRYYLTFLGAQAAHLKGAEQYATLRLIEADFENIRDGWEDAVDARDYDLLGTALEAMHLVCLLLSRLESGKALFDKARQGLAPKAGEDPHPIWLALGIRFYSAEEGHSVLPERLEVSLLQARERNDRSELAYCLHTLATISHYVGQDPQQAIAQYEECVDIYRGIGEKYYLAQTLSRLGEAYQLLGRTDMTRTLVNDALQLQREIGDQMGEAETLPALAMTAYLAGEYDVGVDYLAQTKKISLRTNYRVGVATGNLFMGWMLASKGEFVQGRELLQQALDTALDIVDYSTQAWAYTFLAFIESVSGNQTEAEEHLSRAESIETDPFKQTGAGNPFLHLQVAFTKAFLECNKSNYDDARLRLTQSLQMSILRAGHPYMIHCLALAIPLSVHDGSPEITATLFGLIESQSAWSNGWMKHWALLSRVQAEVVADLGEAAFEAANARGTASSLSATAEEVLRAFEPEDIALEARTPPN